MEKHEGNPRAYAHTIFKGEQVFYKLCTFKPCLLLLRLINLYKEKKKRKYQKKFKVISAFVQSTTGRIQMKIRY